MNNPKVEVYCTSIDNAFLAYMSKNCTEEDLCRRLSIYTKNISEALGFKKKFNVTIIDGKNEFLGMSVYPTLPQLDKIYAKLDKTPLEKFCKSWLIDIEEYNIEIDKNCFNKQVIAFNNRELTAMLLHELAHIAFHTTKAEMFYDSYKIHRAELKAGQKSATRIAQQAIYAIPTLIACGIHAYHTGFDGKKEEYIADKILGIDSYAQDLHNAIDKIVRAYGTSILPSEDYEKKKIDNTVKWCNLNITEMATRRRLIKDDIIYQSANTKSKSLRKAYVNLMAKLGIGFTDRYTNVEIATETVFDRIDSGEYQVTGLLNQVKVVDTDNVAIGALEHAIENALKHDIAMESICKPKLPSDYDIDMIAVEIDRMQNHHDRLYVLDLIYAKIDQINNFMESSKNAGTFNTYKNKCASQLKRLDQLRLELLNKRVSTAGYKVIVNYPVGYEG